MGTWNGILNEVPTQSRKAPCKCQTSTRGRDLRGGWTSYLGNLFHTEGCQLSALYTTLLFTYYVNLGSELVTSVDQEKPLG